MLKRKPITVWARHYKATKDSPSEYVHNHIEDGHSKRDHPKPMCNKQMNAWYKADGWRMTFSYLDENNKVVEA